MKPDDTAINIRRHFENLGGATAGHEIYSEDAVADFGHTGERLVGRADIEDQLRGRRILVTSSPADQPGRRFPHSGLEVTNRSRHA